MRDTIDELYEHVKFIQFVHKKNILLKYLKIYIDTELKVILDHQNNYK